VETELLSLISSGADVFTIAIGAILLRQEKRILRLEYKNFGFDSLKSKK